MYNLHDRYDQQGASDSLFLQNQESQSYLSVFGAKKNEYKYHSKKHILQKNHGFLEITVFLENVKKSHFLFKKVFRFYHRDYITYFEKQPERHV